MTVAPRAERGRRPAVDPLARVAALVLLLAAGCIALYFGLYLTAAAAGQDFSPLAGFPGAATHTGRALLALVVMAAVVVLLALLVRDDEPRLWLELSGDRPVTVVAGGVLMSAATLERSAANALTGHPEVLHAEARARCDARLLRVEVRVVARPLVDEGRLGPDVERRVATVLRPLLGGRDLEVRARVKGVPVRRMARYLT